MTSHFKVFLFTLALWPVAIRIDADITAGIEQVEDAGRYAVERVLLPRKRPAECSLDDDRRCA